MMEKFGLLGERLGHSFSPQIHSRLCGYDYRLYEVAPEQLEQFLAGTDLAGMNVTIPYKKAVLPYCAQLSPAARRMGSVNTLVRRDGGWYGDNTDFFGFKYMVESAGVSAAGKKVAVLGSGGASAAVLAALEDLGAGEVAVISRSGANNYENLHLHADAEIVVNATPVGMYPGNGRSPVTLRAFPNCRAVFDLIYNPARTALMMQAEELGMTAAGGLSMLVAQAWRSAELFTGGDIPWERAQSVLDALGADMRNIILTGMPGCGKSSVGACLAELTGRELLDSDDAVKSLTGLSPAEMIKSQGEAAFRAAETQALAELGKRSGCIIATGGGCVTRPENYPLLHQNGEIVWIKRSLELLPTDGRPLSQRGRLEELYRRREGAYARFADVTVENSGSVRQTAEKILEAIG